MPKRHTHITVADAPHFSVPKFRSLRPGERIPGGFTAISNRFIDNYWAVLSDIGRNVYTVLFRWSSHQEGLVIEMGYQRIADLCGLSTKSVQRAINELIVIGCLKLLREGGSKRDGERVIARYQLLIPNEIPGTVDQPAHSTMDSPVHSTIDRPDHGTMDQPVLDYGPACPPAKQGISQSTNSGGDGVALLIQQGFPEEEAAELAKTTTTEQIANMIENADHIEKTKGFTKGRRAYLRAAIINKYETLAPVAKIKKWKAQQVGTGEPKPQSQKTALAEHEIDIQRHRELLIRVKNLSDEEIVEYKGRIKELAPNRNDFQRRRINLKNREDAWLIKQIIEIMIGDET